MSSHNFLNTSRPAPHHLPIDQLVVPCLCAVKFYSKHSEVAIIRVDHRFRSMVQACLTLLKEIDGFPVAIDTVHVSGTDRWLFVCTTHKSCVWWTNARLIRVPDPLHFYLFYSSVAHVLRTCISLFPVRSLHFHFNHRVISNFVAQALCAHASLRRSRCCITRRKNSRIRIKKRLSECNIDIHTYTHTMMFVIHGL